MIADGDRVMVCLSGARIVHAARHLLSLSAARHRLRADRRQSGPEATRVSGRRPGALSTGWRSFHVIDKTLFGGQARYPFRQDHVRAVLAPAPRRPVRYAAENGITKIAFGSPSRRYRGDLFSTCFSAAGSGDAPKLLSEDNTAHRDSVARYVSRTGDRRYAAGVNSPIILARFAVRRPNMQRLAVKKDAARMGRPVPGRVESIFSSICNASASQLADPRRSISRDSNGCARTVRRDCHVNPAPPPGISRSEATPEPATRPRLEISMRMSREPDGCCVRGRFGAVPPEVPSGSEHHCRRQV